MQPHGGLVESLVEERIHTEPGHDAAPVLVDGLSPSQPLPTLTHAVHPGGHELDHGRHERLLSGQHMDGDTILLEPAPRDVACAGAVIHADMDGHVLANRDQAEGAVPGVRRQIGRERGCVAERFHDSVDAS